MPAGAAGRTDRWGDHDAVVADLNLGFSPLPSRAKRPPIRWAHSYSPLDWERLNTDSDVSDELDALLILMGQGTAEIDSVPLDEVFERALRISTPDYFGRQESPPITSTAEDPIHLGLDACWGGSPEQADTSEVLYRQDSRRV